VLSPYNARFRKQVLSQVTASVSEVTGRADKLIELEDRIRAIVDNLSPKAKAALSAIAEISAVSGRGVGVDYGCEIEDEIRKGGVYRPSRVGFPRRSRNQDAGRGPRAGAPR